MMVSEHIDILIAKYLAGEALPEEAMELEDWKQASGENLRYFEEMADTHGTAFPAVDTEAALARLEKALPGMEVPIISIARRKRTNALRVAAGVALLCLLGAVISYVGLRKSAGEEVFLVSYNDSRTARLNDGTRIEMEPHSKITIEPGYNRSERRLRFEGDAAFTVSHNEEKPFTITAGSLQIRDIGTSFRIKALPDNDTIWVHVSEGIVELRSDKQTPSRLQAGESALFLNTSGKIIEQGPESETEVSSSRIFSFHDEALGQIVSRLETAYGLSIRLESPEAGNCKMTVDFNNEAIETVLSVICETHGLRFEKTAEGYLIKGHSCSR